MLSFQAGRAGAWFLARARGERRHRVEPRSRVMPSCPARDADHRRSTGTLAPARPSLRREMTVDDARLTAPERRRDDGARDMMAVGEFEEHRPALFGVAYRMLGDRAAAED